MGQAKKRGTRAARAARAAKAMEFEVKACAKFEEAVRLRRELEGAQVKAPGPGIKTPVGIPDPSVSKPKAAPPAETWDPDGALTHLDLQNLLGLTGNIPVSGDAVDLLGRIRSKLKKHVGHAAVFVPADVAKLVGVDVLQSAMASEAEAQFLAGVAEDAEKDNAAGS